LRGGRLVKGVGFRDHHDAGRPETTARAHNAQGADEILILDIDSSRERRAPDFDALRRVATECFAPVTFGGGIRSRDDAARAMDAGADKLTLTMTAIDTPNLIDDLAHLLGRQAVVLGIDVVRVGERTMIYDHRCGEPVRDRRFTEWLDEATDRGAGEIRLMSVDREGSRAGMDLELIRQTVARTNIPVTAEGGAGTLEHLAEGLHAGASGVAVGTMLVFSDNNLVKIKRYLQSRDCAMRI
jgi:cyclase